MSKLWQKMYYRTTTISSDGEKRKCLRNILIIDDITKDHLRQVLMKNIIEGRGVVNMLAGEQLRRIC